MTRRKYDPGDGPEALIGAYEELDRAVKERDALAARLAEMTAESAAWRANARDSGEEARKYKARLAEAERLLREVVAEDDEGRWDEGGWGEYLLTSDLRASIDAALAATDRAAPREGASHE